MSTHDDSFRLRALGKRLHELRSGKGLSSRSFGDIAGIDGSKIIKIEKGRGNVTFTVLLRLCRALNISLKDFSDYSFENESVDAVDPLLTPDKVNSLLKDMQSILPITEKLGAHLSGIVRSQYVPKRRFLLKAGEVSRNIYFLESGVMRMFYMKGSEEVYSRFMVEGDFCVDDKSFLRQKPSKLNIQALSSSGCVLYYIAYEELHGIFKKFPSFERAVNELYEKCNVMTAKRRQLSRITKVDERVAWVVENFPEWMERVPAMYLSDYLGISHSALWTHRNAK